MRALYRTAAAIAVSLPLVVAGSAIANASTDGSKTDGSNTDSSMSTGDHHKKHHKAKFDVDQDIAQDAKQDNSNGPTNVSGDHNKFLTEQENEALQSATENAFSK